MFLESRRVFFDEEGDFWSSLEGEEGSEELPKADTKKKLTNLEQKVAQELLKEKRGREHIKNIVERKRLPFSTKVQERILHSMVRIDINAKSKKSTGSGFFVAPNKIMTAAHVTQDNQTSDSEYDYKNEPTYNIKKISATNIAGKRFNISSIDYPKKGDDIAIITVRESSRRYFPISQNDLKKGEQYYNLGYGNDGQFFTNWQDSFFDIQRNQLPNKITGVTPDQLNDQDFFIGLSNPGDSGGPYINSKGEIVSMHISSPETKMNIPFIYRESTPWGSGEKRADLIAAINNHNRKTPQSSPQKPSSLEKNIANIIQQKSEAHPALEWANGIVQVKPGSNERFKKLANQYNKTLQGNR